MANADSEQAVAGSARQADESPARQLEATATEHITPSRAAEHDEHQNQTTKAYAPTPSDEPSHGAYLPNTYFNESLLQSDNTGTRKFKSLLRGLKNIIIKEYETTDNPDIMPSQLARFYEELNGDYNQLFLNTPSQSIAFIYKSLGCSYSLQPAAKALRVEEPEIPALKTEGWIMWSTIQMLLGPDEHAGFLMDAVKRWDVIDPETGKIFPKAIPRESFPAKAEKTMVDWYEGVSERLKKEADEEAEERERQRAIEEHAEHRRITIKRDDEMDSLDSRGPALAYFRNPLYRHVDGRPSIVRIGPPIIARPPRRPPLSPRQTIVDRGKEAATTVGQVIRNVASPHLWDGGSNSSRDRRRRSASAGRHHHTGESPPQGSPYDGRLPLPRQGATRHQRHKSHGSDRIGSSPDDSWDSDQRSPTSLSRPHSRKQDDHDHLLKHSRSHDPTPSQRDYDDYFQNAESHKQRRGSAFDAAAVGIGPSFAPSSDLPMAAQVARYPSRPPPGLDDDRPYPDRRDRHSGTDDARSRSRPRHSDRPDERSRHDERRDSRHRHDGGPPDARTRKDERPYDDRSRREQGPPDARQRRDERHSDGRPRRDERLRDQRHRPDDRSRYDDRPDERSRYDERPSIEERREDGRDRQEDRRADHDPRRRLSDAGSRRSASGRRSNASDMDSGYSGQEDRERRANRKQARFAPISGVDGRRYVDQSPWQE